MRIEHRKNENTGIIHRSLIRRLSAAMMDGDQAAGSAVLSVLRGSFSPGAPLAEELSLHRAIGESRGVSERIARRVIADVIRGCGSLDHAVLRLARRKVLGEMSRFMGEDPLCDCESWPDYRALAAVGALVASTARGAISESVGRARLEEDLVRWMTSPPVAPPPPDPDRSPLALRLAVGSFAADVSALPPESQRLVDAVLVGEASGDVTRYRRLAEGELAESLGILREFRTDDRELAQRVEAVIREVEGVDVGSIDSAMTLIEARLIAEETRR